MPLPPTNIFEVPDQGPLFTGFDTLWESMQVLGYAWSGLPYRPAGHLTANGDLWQSMQSDFGAEFTSGSMGLARSLDQRNFSFNSSLIATKIMASLPGGMGNDPKTKATVLQIANYAAKYGPMVLGTLRANLGGDNDPTGAMGTIIDTAESALDAMYGPMGSIASAQSVLAGSMKNTVDLYRRDTRLQTYIRNKYGADGKTLGYTARKEASYLALEAQRGVNTGLSSSNINSTLFTRDYLLNETPERRRKLDYLVQDLASQSSELKAGLLGGASESQAIDAFIQSRGYNDAQASAFRNYATQLNAIENIKKDIIASGFETKLDLNNSANWSEVINAMSKESEELRIGGSDAQIARANQITSARKRLESLQKAETTANDLGLNLNASTTSYLLSSFRDSNIRETLTAKGLTSGLDDLSKAISIWGRLEQRSSQIGSVDDLAKVENLDAYLKERGVDTTTGNLAKQLFAGGNNSLYSKLNTLFKREQDLKAAGIQQDLDEYREAVRNGTLDQWIEQKPEKAALIEDAIVSLQATERNSMRGHGALETAFSATNSTIGGQAITSPEQVHQIEDMFLQSNWGHFSNEDRDMEFARIGYGMMASNTNAEQAVQYAGQAAKAAKEVGGNATSSSVYGVQSAMAMKQWALQNNITSNLLPSYTARAMGLAPRTMFGRGLSAILAHVDNTGLAKIKDNQAREIIQKAQSGKDLSIEEMRIIEDRSEEILHEMGLTNSSIRDALNIDYSREKFARYVANQGTRLLMAGSRINQRLGYDAAEGGLRESGSRKAYQSNVIQKILFDAATEKDSLLFSNSDKLNDSIIQQAIKAGARPEEIADLRRMIKEDSHAFTRIVNTIAKGQADENNTTVDEWQNLQKASKAGDAVFNQQIIADLQSAMPKGENNAFSRALVELKKNPNATITDLLQVAKSHNLTDEEKQRLSTVAALSGIMGDPNSKLVAMGPRAQAAHQKTMSNLVRGAIIAGSNTDRIEELIQKRITTGWTDDERLEFEKYRKQGDVREDDVNKLIAATQTGYIKAMEFIEKEKDSGSTTINANEIKKPEAISNDNTTGEGTTAKADGKSLPMEKNAVRVFVVNTPPNNDGTPDPKPVA